MDVIAKLVWLYLADRWHRPLTGLGPAQDDMRAALGAEVDRLRNSVEFRLNV